MRLLLVAGARPNFVKLASLCRALDAAGGFDRRIVHTGQHYSDALSDVFFTELSIPRPDVNLGVGSGTGAWQTAEIMRRFEVPLLDVRPDLVVVVGDVNSTLACALTAVKSGFPVAHVEAGLRSFDLRMPEETNRRVTDAVSEILFVSEKAGVANLAREGIDPGRVHLVGNVMIDTLLEHRERARARDVCARFGVRRREVVVATLHRPGNVEDRARLSALFTGLRRVSERVPVLLPAHPRTAAALASLGLAGTGSLRIIEPLGYLDFLGLISDAMAVITDSGGIQEETTVLGVPCLTARDNTERPITVEQGTNTLVGCDADRIVREVDRILGGERPAGRVPALWDGRAADRIVGVLEAREG